MTLRVMLMISSMRGGGSERQTLLLLKHLDRSKFSPHLYLLDRAGEFLSDVPDDVTIHCFADADRDDGFYFPGRQLRRQSRHVADVISDNAVDVVYDRTFHMTMIAGPACDRLHRSRVSTIVSPPHRALPLVEQRFVSAKRRRLSKAYRRSRHVVAVSKQSADSAEDYYSLPSGSVRVIANPVDTPAVRELASASNIDRDDRLTLVCVGRMTPEKGHRDLIEAIHLCERDWPTDRTGIRLWLVGDGPLRPSLEQFSAAGPPGIHTIEFLGAQPNAAPYISTADALVLPSLFEGMPNVVLEGMALETPVIATRAGGTIELERDEPTILWAEPGNPVSLANAIREFASDRASGQDRAVAALSMIQQHHDVATQTQRIESLLHDCADS